MGAPGGTGKVSRWDETPVVAAGGAGGKTRKRSRWDETPADVNAGGMGGDATPLAIDPSATPLAGGMGGSLEVVQQMRWEQEIADRNRPMSDQELDSLFPETGYRVLDPPSGYVPLRTPSRRLLATPTPMGQTPGFQLTATPAREEYGIPQTPSESGLPFIKPEDMQYLASWLQKGVRRMKPCLLRRSRTSGGLCGCC
jgi:splicing factor 3B subunit 1